CGLAIGSHVSHGAPRRTPFHEGGSLAGKLSKDARSTSSTLTCRLAITRSRSILRSSCVSKSVDIVVSRESKRGYAVSSADESSNQEWHKLRSGSYDLLLESNGSIRR